MKEQAGSLVCVGPGIILGAHITERCKNHIKHADIVFISCHPAVEQWIATMNSNMVSLQQFYADDKDRRITYQEMQSAMVEAVRAGKRVVGVFYGHPGVFAQVPHKTIKQLKAEGYSASMEPGIGADACLYADMGIDPGAYGCQQFEASQFMFYERKIDPSAYLILWQLGHAGDLSLTAKQADQRGLTVLVTMLSEIYPAEHLVAIYESPFLPTQTPRIDWYPLSELSEANVTLISTLVIPPCQKLKPNNDIVRRLKSISASDRGRNSN